MIEQVEALEHSGRVSNLAEELVTAYEELNVIYDVDEALMGTVETGDAVDVAISEAVNLVRAEWGVAILLNEKRDDIEFVREIGISRVKGERRDEFCLGSVKSLNGCGKGVIINNVVGGENSNCCHFACRCFMKVPFCTKNDVIGMMCLGNKEGKEGFSSRDLKLINAIAARTASVIDSKRLQSHYIEKQRIEEELLLAKNIQEGLFPRECPVIKGYKVAASAGVCTEVGGDYYDFIPLKGGEMALVMGDVSGHGIGAALMMSSMRSALRAMAGPETSSLVEGLNKIMVEDSRGKGMMMTLFYAVLNPEDGKLTYTNAGHDYPFIVRGKGNVDFLKSNGGLLGVFDGLLFREDNVYLGDGDIFVMYTDGITERENPDGVQFGVERLVDLVGKLGNMSPFAIIEGINEELDRFSEGTPVNDDIAMIVIKVER